MGYMVATKLVSLSVGVVWTAVMLRLMGPAAYMSLADWLPRAYMSISGWLTPPYLYLIMNGIILSIAASSRFSPPESVHVKDSIAVLVPVPGQDPVQVPVSAPLPVPVPGSVPLPDPIPVQVPTPLPVPTPRLERKSIFEITDVEDEEQEEEEEFVIRGLRWDMEDRKDEGAVPSSVYTESLVEPIVRVDSMEMPSEYTKLIESVERPPVSSRFSRKSVRASPDGKALRVAKSRKGQTLESTWRTITEGRPMPLTRHLKKSDTWESRVERNISDDVAPHLGPTMCKSETIHEKGGAESPVVSSGKKKVKREPSLSQDDLNRRVESFIKKFNEEMRLQRQESFKHYMDMMNRGADQ